MILRFREAEACSAFQGRLQEEHPDLARITKVSYTQPDVLLLLGSDTEAHERIAALCADAASRIEDVRFGTADGA